MLALALVLLGFTACEAQSPQERLDQMMKDVDARYPRVTHVEVGEIEDPLYVDVRSEREMAVSRIPGSISGRAWQDHPELAKGRALVFYCTIGVRSSEAALLAQKQGHQAHNLRGGILAWCWAGRPLKGTEGEETSWVHVYGDTWNLLPKGYRAVLD